MDTLYVIQNQNGHYLSKQKEWVDGSDRRVLYRSAHKDEVINQIFELSSKDIGLRATRLDCEADEQGNPIVRVSDIPLPGVDDTDSDSDQQTADASEAAAESDTAKNDAELETDAPQPHLSTESSDGFNH